MFAIHLSLLCWHFGKYCCSLRNKNFHGDETDEGDEGV